MSQIHVLDMPDDMTLVGPWLDEHVASGHLAELVAELEALHGRGPEETQRPPRPEDAAAWLGDRLPAVLAGGLRQLEAARLGELLRRPRLLPAIQELVFIEGGDHWNNLVADVAPASLAAIEGRIGLDRRPTAVARPGPVVASAPRRRAWKAPAVRWVAAVAAGLLVAVAGWRLFEAGRPPLQPGGERMPLAQKPAPDYLDDVIAATAGWLPEPRDTEAGLRASLEHALAACDTLIAAAHEPLADEDRQWLVERCSAWRKAFAEQLAALDATHDVDTAAAASAATLEKLRKAIAGRAAEIRARAA